MNSIDALCLAVLAADGSDLHLMEGQPPKLRRHGDIESLRATPLTRAEIAQLLHPLVSAETWEKFHTTGDLDFAYAIASHGTRFRCNYYKHLHGLGAVLRLIPSRIKTIAELNLPPVLTSFAHFKSGLVLVTGPTGSGKSTTLAAIIDHINTTQTRHIVTLEQPIEFLHENKNSLLTQREIPLDAPTFAAGLKAALREDADVLLVGELRDRETIHLALTAAEMGLLVFATLHTNSAPKTIDRLIDTFPAEQQPQIRTMLAHSLQAICAQLLVKRTDGQGRVAQNEILIATPAVRAIIREGATAKLVDVIKTGRAEGMMAMEEMAQ